MGFLKSDHWIVLSFISAAVLLNLGTFYSFLLLTFVIFFGYIAYYYGDFIYRSYLTLNRDLSGLVLLIRVSFDLRRRLRENRGIHQIFLDIVKRNPKKICAIDISTDKTYTFEEFNKLCNYFANYFQNRGYVEGDIVVIFMENSVEFVAAWMGLAKIGVVTAWINSNLKMQPLAYCLKSSDVKGVISSETLSNVLQATKNSGFLNVNFDEFVYGSVPYGVNAINLKDEFKRLSINSKFDNEPTPPKKVDFKSILCFIYTSGTTGMPKAALMKHFRYYSMVMGSAKSFGIFSEDRLYISMPLYHTSAGIIGIGQVLLQGSSCAIRSKFSASNFWKDCVKYECTASQYIGEICRYLLAQPILLEESQHKVRLLYGNGLRAEIWKEFIERFNVKIGELYGSTEGTSNLVNIDGKIGSCGFLPISPLTSKLHPVRLVKIDKVTLEVLRGEDGLCIPCRPGQIGAMVSTIKKNNPLLIFEGYLNKNETNKKVIYNVFQKNDSAFLTGDILYWDRLGYVYFKDRTGDTFRWKGENVSTTEVEAVLQPLKSIIDLTVYGVTIPGTEGRAGMIAIVRENEGNESKEEFFNQIATLLLKNLPLYAIPVFIRLCGSVDKTGTFKLVKTNLQQIGYNQPLKEGINDDELYIWDNASKSYKQFDDEKRALVESGNISRFL